MSKYPLFESGRAAADANGIAQVTIGPYRAFEKWNVTRVTVQSTSTTLIPMAKVYRGAEAESRLIDGTHTGTLDHSDTSIILQSGEQLLVVWSGSDVGAECTVTVEGESVRR